jgi:phosphorylase kinase alpha/beta subunit
MRIVVKFSTNPGKTFVQLPICEFFSTSLQPQAPTIAPEYRQLNIEALMALAAFSEKNPDLKVEEYMVLNVIIGHAVRLAWLDPNLPKPLVTGESDLRSEFYAVHKAQAWSNFYETAPTVCGGYMIRSLQFLSQLAVN